MSDAVEVRNLKKYYRSGIRSRKVVALDGASFSVRRGEIFGLLGANGAGKSTTIKIITGLMRPSAGECLIFGEKISKSVKSRIGYLPESP